jgi:hypothetical protein
MTCVTAKARASYPMVQLGRWCVWTALCRVTAGLLPLRGLLRWRGKGFASPWMESISEVGSRGGIHSAGRGGSPINRIFLGIGGEKDCRAPPLRGGGGNPLGDGRSIPTTRLRTFKKQRTTLPLPGMPTVGVFLP